MLNENIKCEIEYQLLYNYLDKYKNKSVNLNDYQINPTVLINKTIWLFWMQGYEHAPLIIKKCMDSVKRNKPLDYEIVILTQENIEQYIHLPNFVWEKYNDGKITITHLSDIIRLELIYRYGGAWIDATVYCSEKIPLYMLDGDMFMFKSTNIGKSVLKGSSWWIYAKKGEKIISDARMLLYTYWKKERKLKNYFLLHIVLSKVIDDSSYNRATYRNMPSKCNSDPHNLSAVLAMEYDERVWSIIKSNSSIHKLSYKRKYLQGDIYNFYLALVDGNLQ